MFSCDTMVVCAPYSKYGQNTFAKNSDRPTGEPQPLCFYPAREYAKGEVLRLTHLTIPQVERTYAVIGSRPYWIYGFEMGYNEKGLVIGNEAEGSRLPPDGEDGILGMDLLRLGLERAATAREAITVITQLLEKYGQKARASMLTERVYENTFILCDPKEAWVLETAGREWVAKRIERMQGISNCYSIGGDAEMMSANVERIARERRFLAPDAPFDFAKAYSGRQVGQPAGVQRFRRLNKLLSQKECHDFDSLAAILRDHYEDELIAPRFGVTSGTFRTICMHMVDFGSSETSASLLARYDEELGIIARYAPAQPCLSVYIPVYMTSLPERMQKADRYYDSETLWWQVKRLSMLVAVDEEAYFEEIRARLSKLESIFKQRAEDAEREARGLLRAGDEASAKARLAHVTEECTEQLFLIAKGESARLANRIRKAGGLYGRVKEELEKYAEYAGIELL